MSPERMGSPQDDTVAAPKMSVPASPIAGTPMCEAQSPISFLLAVAQAENTRSPDDDLTSLSWLHEKDILKGINIDPSPTNSTNSTPKQQYLTLSNIFPDQSPTSDYIEDSSISPGESSNSSINSSLHTQTFQYNQSRNKHPHNIPYDPLIHTNNKPPYSFSCLIFMAIEESPQKALPVKEIYSWILGHFPYFQNAPTGWKNSVRHNLSLNKCFQKVEKAPNLGKGSLWTVDPQYKPNLIQALTRSPFHSCSNLDSSSIVNNNSPVKVEKEKESSPSNSLVNRLPDPQLFPYLSKTLASVEMNNHVKVEPSDDSLDAVDAATVMLSLKNGPTLRQKKKHVWQVITTSPSQDHTYSAANSVSGRNEAFESDDEKDKKSTCRKIDFEDDDEEEKRKIKGAETLLHLAGLTRTRNGSYSEPLTNKRMKYSQNNDSQKELSFKPRLLRSKRKDIRQNLLNNNNNNEWMKHRKELQTSPNAR